MEKPSKPICTQYKRIECAYCIDRGKESCCLSTPKYQKLNENWKKRMHAKADAIHEIDLQIEKLKAQRREMLVRLPQKDLDRVAYYLDHMSE